MAGRLNPVVHGVRRPIRSFLAGAYGHSIEYLERIIDTSCMQRFPVNGSGRQLNQPGRQRDFETQRNREMAIAEWAVHMVESVLTELRDSAVYRDGESLGALGLAVPDAYTCLTHPQAEAHSRLRMEAAAFILLSSLLSKRHTKKFNMRVIEAQLMNVCLEHLNHEKKHAGPRA